MPLRTATILLAALAGAGVSSAADPIADEAAGVTFHDLTANEASGIDYRRVPSATNAVFERIEEEPLYTMPLVVATPERPGGSPGVALLDLDGDPAYPVEHGSPFDATARSMAASALRAPTGSVRSSPR